ncbi:MAG: XRE family transcriptional regulator [Bdellovibrionota bacterium]
MVTSIDKISKNLAFNVAALRKTRQLTQAALAKLAGITRASVTLIESGNSNPTLEILLKLSLALQTSIDELTNTPIAECTLIPSRAVPIDSRSKNGITLRKLLPDKIRATEIDEITLDTGSALKGSPHIEGTKEYFICIDGKIRIGVLGELHHLSKGDVLSFPGDKPHSYKNDGRTKARGISVVLFNPNK